MEELKNDVVELDDEDICKCGGMFGPVVAESTRWLARIVPDCWAMAVLVAPS